MDNVNSVTERAQKWLDGSFDDETKAIVKNLMETNLSYHRELRQNRGKILFAGIFDY